jgi:hypothetical protein
MTGQKFVMIIIALFVGFGIGYVILNGSKQNSSISAPQTKQAPGPSAGERLAAIHQACLPRYVTLDEFVRAHRGETPYQLNLFVEMTEENTRQCMEVALYRDPEAAAIYAHVHRAVSGEIR